MAEKDWVEQIKKELNEYAIGNEDLDRVLAPLLKVCSELSKNYDEFKQCINEAITTLKSVVGKVRP